MKLRIGVAYILAALTGFLAGMEYASHQVAKATCEARTFNSYEVLPDWSIRCYTIMTVEDE